MEKKKVLFNGAEMFVADMPEIFPDMDDRLRRALGGDISSVVVFTGWDAKSYWGAVLAEDVYDSNFFGKRIGRITELGECSGRAGDTERAMNYISVEAEDAGYDYVFCPFRPMRTGLDVALEKNGFKLCTVNVDMEADVSGDVSHGHAKEKFHIRAARSGDAPGAMEAAHNAFKKSRFYNMGIVLSAKVDDYHARWVENLMADRGKTVIVAEEDDKVAGFLAFETGKPAGTGRIVLLAVNEAQRGKGVGGLLVTRAMVTGSLSGAGKMFVKTQSDNAPAIGLYEKYGFKTYTKEYVYHKILKN